MCIFILIYCMQATRSVYVCILPLWISGVRGVEVYDISIHACLAWQRIDDKSARISSASILLADSDVLINWWITLNRKYNRIFSVHPWLFSWSIPIWRLIVKLFDPVTLVFHVNRREKRYFVSHTDSAAAATKCQDLCWFLVVGFLWPEIQSSMYSEWAWDEWTNGFQKSTPLSPPPGWNHPKYGVNQMLTRPCKVAASTGFRCGFYQHDGDVCFSMATILRTLKSNTEKESCVWEKVGILTEEVGVDLFFVCTVIFCFTRG